MVMPTLPSALAGVASKATAPTNAQIAAPLCNHTMVLIRLPSKGFGFKSGLVFRTALAPWEAFLAAAYLQVNGAPIFCHSNILSIESGQVGLRRNHSVDRLWGHPQGAPEL